MRNLVHPAHMLARRILTATGLSKPFRRYLGPIAGRVLANVASKPGLTSIVRGHQMYLAPPGGFPPLALALDQYEVGTTRLIESILRPGMVFVDAGAHVGYYTLIAAGLVGPQGRVYAFEPDPANHEILVKNIEVNGYTNITPIRSALSNRPGTASLHITSLDTGRHSLYRQNIPLKGQVEVAVTTLDTFLGTQGWPQVDLIKMDVEGAEQDVLDGMSEILEKTPQPKLVLEFNPSLLSKAGVGLSEFLDRFSSWGMDVQWVNEDQGLMRLNDGGRSALVADLLSHDRSMNLFCSVQ